VLFRSIAGISMAFLGYSAGNLGLVARLSLLTGSCLLIPHNIMANVLGYLILLVVIYRRRIYAPLKPGSAGTG
jgi:hypothetical protein